MAEMSQIGLVLNRFAAPQLGISGWDGDGFLNGLCGPLRRRALVNGDALGLLIYITKRQVFTKEQMRSALIIFQVQYARQIDVEKEIMKAF
jgi:hypothetical protein